MRAAKKAVLEALALVLVGSAVGLAGNAARARGLDLLTNYRPPAKTLDIIVAEESDSGEVNEYGLLEVTLEQVSCCFQDPAYNPNPADSHILFIDARNDAHYAEGHIPGAVQVDHYYKDEYLPEILPLIETVDEVILYCTGPECDDSLLVGLDLIDEGVPLDKIVLFKGGWEAWAEANMPIATGMK
ncbi:MAG: hypothetical protein KAV82_05290 [Phycisphaerae bacterium]|nr:hypothetical protein [Phycisphaerae bacterium]